MIAPQARHALAAPGPLSKMLTLATTLHLVSRPNSSALPAMSATPTLLLNALMDGPLKKVTMSASFAQFTGRAPLRPWCILIRSTADKCAVCTDQQLDRPNAQSPTPATISRSGTQHQLNAPKEPGQQVLQWRVMNVPPDTSAQIRTSL